MTEIPLRPFQIKGRDKILQHKGFIIADQMGLGKTRTVLAAIDESQSKTILIVCTKNAFPTWKNQGLEWLEGLKVVYIRGDKEKRLDLWNSRNPDPSNPVMFVCTSACFRNDVQSVPKKWDFVALDEYDRFMSNRSQTQNKLKKLHWKYLVPVSGTPARKGPQNLWPVLNLIDRRKFSSYWRFVNTFCHVDDTPFGKQVYGVRNVVELRELLSQYLIRHTKAEVAPEVPPKQRSRLPVEMVPKQAEIYRQIEKDMIGLINDEVYVVENVLEKLTRLRQLLCCPKILDPSLPDGGGLDTIIDMMRTESAHSIIFVPFIAAIPYVKARLLVEGFGPVVTLQGGLDVIELDRRVNLFKKERGVCVCSIHYAQSFELDTSQYDYFLGFAWDADTNEQAEDRSHRMTTRHVLNCYYIMHEGTVDNDLLDSVNEKRFNFNRMFPSQKQLQKLFVPTKDSS